MGKHSIKLVKYIDEQVKFVRSLMKSKYQTIEKSTDLATSVLDKRLDSMNEFRQALKDQQLTFVSKTEYQISHHRVVEDIKMLREAKANLEGKASMTSVIIAYIIGIIGIILGIVRLFM